MREPKQINITHNEKSLDFIISKIPATEGRDIVAKYSFTNLPKIGDFKVSQETMLKLISYTAVIAVGPDGDTLQVRLSDKKLIDGHLPDWEMLMKLEMAMLEYNVSFLARGRVSGFLDNFAQKIQQWILSMLTDSSVQSSPTVAPPSTN
jgi:hypothetical protein